jgi:hypothetical protein
MESDRDELDLTDVDVPTFSPVPPPPVDPPRRRPSRGPHIPFAKFAPAFLGIAALVGIERTSMVIVVAESYPTWVRLTALGVFCAVVTVVAVVGGVIFARNFGK